jgi:hypothetical protein
MNTTQEHIFQYYSKKRCIEYKKNLLCGLPCVNNSAYCEGCSKKYADHSPKVKSKKSSWY